MADLILPQCRRQPLTQMMGGNTTTYNYNDASQLTGTTGAQAATYTNDNAGQRTAQAIGANTTNYAYDGLGRLTALSGAQSGSYAYDGQGQRVQRTVGGNTINYGRDAAGALLTDGSQDYVNGLGLVSRESGSTASYAATDGRSSVRVVTDTSGQVAGTTRYEAFGTPTAQSGTQLAKGFGGIETDAESGLLLAGGGVYYDASVGRMLSNGSAGGASMGGSVPDWLRIGGDTCVLGAGGLACASTALPHAVGHCEIDQASGVPAPVSCPAGSAAYLPPAPDPRTVIGGDPWAGAPAPTPPSQPPSWQHDEDDCSYAADPYDCYARAPRGGNGGTYWSSQVNWECDARRARATGQSSLQVLYGGWVLCHELGADEIPVRMDLISIAFDIKTRSPGDGFFSDVLPGEVAGLVICIDTTTCDSPTVLREAYYIPDADAPFHEYVGASGQTVRIGMTVLACRPVTSCRINRGEFTPFTLE